MKLLNTLLIILISVAYVLSAGVYKVKVDNTLNIRKEDSTESDVVGKLKNGQYIYVTSVINGWAKFYKGYVSTDYLTKVNASNNYVTKAKLKFRNGPSSDHNIVAILNKGTKVTYFGEDPFTSSWAVTSRGYALVKYLGKINEKTTTTNATNNLVKKNGKNATKITNTSTPEVYKVKVDDTLNVRKESNTKSDIVGKLKNGQYIYATSVSNGWAKFYKGYVSADYLTKASGGSSYVTNGNLNFREGPTTQYKILTTLKKGTQVTYFGTDPFINNWAVTNRGYANIKYLDKDKNGNSTNNSTSTSTSEVKSTEKAKLGESPGAYKVKVDNTLNIRKENNTKSDIVEKLSNGQYIFATSVTNGWAKFYQGYVSTDYLIKVGDIEGYISGGSTFETKANLNFRVGPTTNHSIIDTLKEGTRVTYFGKDPFYPNWAITNRGYCNFSYLEKVNDQPTTNTNSSQINTSNNNNDLEYPSYATKNVFGVKFLNIVLLSILSYVIIEHLNII